MHDRSLEQLIQGGAGDDVLTGTFDQDTLWGGDGNDVIHGFGGSDSLRGDGGNDQLFGGDGTDSLDGGAGDDLVYGGSGDDAIRDSQGGSDSLWGEDGNDAIVVDRNGLGPVASRLFLSGGAGDDTIRVRYSPQTGTENISHYVIDGGAGDDIVDASGWIDFSADLGDGNDRLNIGVSMGGGVVRLGGGQDYIQFNWASPTPLTFTIADFQTGDQGDRIDFTRALSWSQSQGDHPNPFHAGLASLEQRGADVILRVGLQRIVLENVQISDLRATNFSGMLPGTAAAYSGGNMFGSNWGEQIWGSRGGDHIYGGAGGDVLYGGEGNDVLHGESGNDEFTGGAGDDLIYGGAGDDEVRDSIVHSIEGGNDTFFGEAGDDRVYLARNGAENSHFIMSGGTGNDSFDNNTNPYSGSLGRVTFDGGDGDDVLSARNIDHWTFDGGTGNDSLFIRGVYRGADLFFGEGTFEGGSGHDNVVLDERASSLSITVMDDRTFRVGDAVVRDIEGFTFYARGMTRDFSYMPHGLTLEVTYGPNVLTGTAFDDTLVGGTEGDILDGGLGYDTAVFRGAFRDYVINTQDGVTTVTLKSNPYYDGPDKISNIERIQFSDGWYTLEGVYIPAIILGSDGIDNLKGHSWSDTILAGAGDDLILTSGGNDRIDGGAGNDVVEVAYGRDFYTILQVGDDFLLKGPVGSTYLTGVEVLIFNDGSIIDLHRIYSESSGCDNNSQKINTEIDPLVLPGLGDMAEEQKPEVELLEFKSDNDFNALHSSELVPLTRPFDDFLS